jgi:hypothetical protein
MTGMTVASGPLRRGIYFLCTMTINPYWIELLFDGQGPNYLVNVHIYIYRFFFMEEKHQISL